MKKTTHTRISTALPKDLLTKIDVLVKAARCPSRSAFIEEALAQKLREHGEVGMENGKPDAGLSANAGDVSPLPAEASSPDSIHHSPFTIHHD
jgi:Arc/MetJ-type ribon-helix-helix transcriptional regulator